MYIAPGRIFDLGGWTDHPENNEHGATLNMAIKKYAYAKPLIDKFEYGFKDLPKQSGWGSSGALNVAQVALAMNEDVIRDKKAIAAAAYIQERNLGHICGIQDHLAAAYGGMRLYEFPPGLEQRWMTSLMHGVERPVPTNIVVHPEVPREHVETLAERLTLVYLPEKRLSGNVKPDIRYIIAKNKDTLCAMKDIAISTYKQLCKGDFSNIKETLREYSELENSLAPGVTNENIDKLIGAGKLSLTPGRVLGAGGGSVMFYTDTEGEYLELRKNINRTGVRIVFYDVKPDFEGVREVDNNFDFYK